MSSELNHIEVERRGTGYRMKAKHLHSLLQYVNQETYSTVHPRLMYEILIRRGVVVKGFVPSKERLVRIYQLSSETADKFVKLGLENEC